jgi:hypothetical protein
VNTILTEIATKAKVEHCISHVRLQEFAELLVKETISKMSQQLDAHGDNQANNPSYYKSINDTLKHFGIEK